MTNLKERAKTQKVLCVLARTLTAEGVIVGLQPASDGLIHILLLDTLNAQIWKTESKYTA